MDFILTKATDRSADSDFLMLTTVFRNDMWEYVLTSILPYDAVVPVPMEEYLMLLPSMSMGAREDWIQEVTYYFTGNRAGSHYICLN